MLKRLRRDQVSRRATRSKVNSVRTQKAAATAPLKRAAKVDPHIPPLPVPNHGKFGLLIARAIAKSAQTDMKPAMGKKMAGISQGKSSTTS